MKSDFIRTDFTYQYPPFNLMRTNEVDLLSAREPMHVYVHLPFCRTKCQYCYYKTWGVGMDAEDEIQHYLNLLYKEIALRARQPQIQGKTAKSLYIGGGTPSLLSPQQLQTLVDVLTSELNFADGYEFCMEAKPDEDIMTPEKIDCFKQIGVTRLSMGVESLSDELLRANGRAGSAAAVRRVYRLARECRFPVINLDFLSGLVNENWENWRAQTAEILDLVPENVSFYKLEFYLNTRLSQRVRKNELKARICDDTEEAEMAQYAFDLLQQEGGYVPCHCFTLIAEPRFEHVHTGGVWSGEALLGFGLSAYGVMNDVLYQNTWTVEEYGAMIEQGKLPAQRAHYISAREKIARTMVYGVKTLYLSRQDFKKKHGFDMSLVYGDLIEELLKEGLVEFDDEALRVPRSKCIYADDICRHFFLPEHETMMRGHFTREEVIKRLANSAAVSLNPELVQLRA